MNFFYKITLLFVLIFSSTALYAQIDNRDKGIELYKRGDSNIEAIRLLELASKDKTTENDGDVWNYLGLAYLHQNKMTEALSAFERAVKLKPGDASIHTGLAYLYLNIDKIDKAQSQAETALQLDPKSTDAYYARSTVNRRKGRLPEAIKDAEQAIAVNPDFVEAYILKSEILLDSFEKKWQKSKEPLRDFSLLEESIKLLEECLQKCSQNKLQPIRKSLEISSLSLDYFSKRKPGKVEISLKQPAPRIPDEPNKTQVKMLTHPWVNFTEAARSAKVQGTVVLAVLFGADATVKRIFVVQSLGNGLDEEAVKAAAQTLFEPAKENGKPVSVMKEVYYSFSAT